MNGKRALSNNLTIPHYRFKYHEEFNKCERVKDQNITILYKRIKNHNQPIWLNES